MKSSKKIPINFSKIEWDIQEAPCNNHSFRFFNEGIVDMRKFYGFGVKWQIYGNQKGHGYLFTDIKELLKIGEKLLVYFKKTNNRRKLLKAINGFNIKMETIFKICNSESLKTRKLNEIEALYRNLLNIFFDYYRLAIFIEPLDAVLDREFRHLYADLGRSERENFITMTLAHKIGFVQREQLNILKIATTIKNKKLGGLLNRTPAQTFLSMLKNKYPQVNNLLEKHRNDYIWLRGGYLDTPGLSFFDILERIKEIVRQKNIQKEIYKLKNYETITKKEKQKIHKKYKFANKIKYMTLLIDELSYFHDERKEYVLKWLYYCNRVLKEIARRFKVLYGDLQYSLPQEVLGLFEGKKIDKKLLKNRYPYFLYFKTRAETYMMAGKEAHDFWQKNLSKKSIEKFLLHGICGALGKVIGRVSVITHPSDFSRFKDGQILVTTMTRPEFIPLMQKAKAIITDQGGITCHAAIISRELGIPCVIGTKDATNVLKDGDLVEVNANHGLVKILEG